MPKSSLTIRMEKSLLEKLKRRSKADQLSVSYVANIAIAVYLDFPHLPSLPARVAAVESELKVIRDRLARAERR